MNKTPSGAPRVTDMKVIPVAGQDSSHAFTAGLRLVWEAVTGPHW